jgi:hypothetical protein
MKRLILSAVVAVALVSGCDWTVKTRVSRTAPLIWHIEADGRVPETWLMHTCPSVGEAILRFRATPGDAGSGIDVYCEPRR